MSDRLEEIRGYLGCADLHRATPSIAMALRQDALWLIDEIDRLMEENDKLREERLEQVATIEHMKEQSRGKLP